MRRVSIALIVMGGGVAVLAAELAHGLATQAAHRERLARNAALVRALGLTDPALFTEARYARHLTQADRFTPFQDAPASFEHFPSGSLVLPPPQIRRGRARIVTGARPPRPASPTIRTRREERP